MPRAKPPEEYTRVVLTTEGIDEGYPMILEVGALKWAADDAVPVVDNFNFDRVPLGKAQNIRREDDGTITVEVPEKLILREKKKLPEGGKPLVNFNLYANEVLMVPESIEEKKSRIEENKPRRVQSCQLRAIARVPIPFSYEL